SIGCVLAVGNCAKAQHRKNESRTYRLEAEPSFHSPPPKRDSCPHRCIDVGRATFITLTVQCTAIVCYSENRYRNLPVICNSTYLADPSLTLRVPLMLPVFGATEVSGAAPRDGSI